MYAAADSWLPAESMSIISKSGKYVVHIVPGESLGEVYGFGGEKIGQHAKARYYRYRNDAYEKYSEFDLLNPISPVIAEVANNGNLITIDNWHNIGYGYVIVVYSSKGQVINKYSLSNIYKESDLGGIERSTSSLWWRCKEIPPEMERHNRNYIIHDFAGNKLSLDVKSGEINSETGFGSCSK